MNCENLKMVGDLTEWMENLIIVDSIYCIKMNFDLFRRSLEHFANVSITSKVMKFFFFFKLN